MIISQLHQQAVALDPQQHGKLKLQWPLTDWSVAARLNSIFVAVAEFTDVCKEYPIVFVRAGHEADGSEQIAPVAVLGVVADENLYLEGPAGQPQGWRAAYRPAVLQAYPFGIARIDDERVAVCLDAGWSGVSTEIGQPLFDSAGQPAELLSAMQQHLQLLEGQIQSTRLFGRRLQELELLREMRFEATLPDGRKHTVDGFLTVDADKAQNLSDAIVGDLHRTGMLGLIHLHWASLGLMRRLMDMHVQRLPATAGATVSAPAPASAPAASAPAV